MTGFVRDNPADAVLLRMNESSRVHAFALTELSSDSLATRLVRQLRLASVELRSDPIGLVRSLIVDDAVDRHARRVLWAVRLGLPTASIGGFALGVLLYLCLFGRPVTVVASAPDRSSLQIWSIVDVADTPRPADTPKPGGGGGGDNDPLPVSKGVVPPSSLADPIVPATTKPVQPPPMPLPVPPPLLAPPVPVETGIFGDPRGLPTQPSDGPGTDGGAGTGEKGGWGAGRGPGKVDGVLGGPGGTGTTPTGGARKPAHAVAVKARILNTPRPSYTEEARQNHTEGAVKVSVLLGADGRIRNARVVAGLPHGLNERALAAVSAIRFVPARDANGNAIDSSITVSVRFTIR